MEEGEIHGNKMVHIVCGCVYRHCDLFNVNKIDNLLVQLILEAIVKYLAHNVTGPN